MVITEHWFTYGEPSIRPLDKNYIGDSQEERHIYLALQIILSFEKKLITQEYKTTEVVFKCQ